MSTLKKLVENQKKANKAVPTRKPQKSNRGRLGVGVVKCGNPKSPKFGQPVGKCEFVSVPECNVAGREVNREFGCKYALLTHE